MKDLVLELDLTPPETKAEIEKAKAKKSSEDDQLGAELYSRWDSWQTSRRLIEEEWLKDLRAYNQQNESDKEKLSKFHSDIYIGITRTKCMSAYSRVVDILFQSKDKHWGIEPTPVPFDGVGQPKTEELQQYLDDMKLRSERMETEIDDHLVELDYEEHVKSAILEACILGTGVIKGVTPTVKTETRWGQLEDGSWDITIEEKPFPVMSSPSIFEVYPDPYATCSEDVSGVFERHVLTRSQFSALREDSRFDSKKIKSILDRTDRGNHTPVYHETERRSIANISETSGANSDRYDVLEYWGEVSGKLLELYCTSEDIDPTETYMANVWVCDSLALYARLSPLKKQQLPYHFFPYFKAPYQFWGIGPARMMRSSQQTLNGSIRAMLDGMAMAAIPMAEVNVTMLREGQDPRRIEPGMIYLRDNGDPGVPAVRFFQPSIPTGQLMQMSEMFKRYADDESSIPAYSYGDTSNEANKTAKGMSLLMSASTLPIKMVVKNLEDFCIRPFIQSVFDWLMEWSDKDEIKGDMDIVVLGTTSLMAKEIRSQQLMQFLNISSNQLDAPLVNRRYLLTQIAKSLEIDVNKVLLEEEEVQLKMESQAKESAIDLAKAALYQMQTAREQANIDKIVAETANTNVKSQYAATQTAATAIMNQNVLPVSDELLKSAGYKDYDGPPIANNPFPEQGMPQQPMMGSEPTLQEGAPPVRQNTSPANPPVPQRPDDAGLRDFDQQFNRMANPQMPSSALKGIETKENDGIDNDFYVDNIKF